MNVFVHSLRRGALLGILLSLGSLSAVAQSVLRLKAASPDLPLSETRVWLPRLKLSLSPATDGTVSLPLLATTDTLRITHPEARTLSLTRADLERMNYTITLSVRDWLFDDVVIAANRAPEAPLIVPQVVDVIARAELTRRQPLTTADALEQQGAFVQRSQLGGGSVVLRGFEASRVLTVVDGIRMNNAIYRSGHLQNLITVDPAGLDRIEVVAGPGSVLYGSDALGGVVHLTTRPAQLADSGRAWQLSGTSFVRYASAADAPAAHLAFNLGTPRFASRTAITALRQGDLRAGNIRLPIWGTTGSRTFTQSEINGADIAMPNADPNRQTLSGYDQLDMLQKFLFAVKPSLRLTLNAQLSTSSNVPRFDRLSEVTGAGAPRFAEWYYGPQVRLLIAPGLELDRSSGLFDHARILLSYQQIHEYRLTRRWQNPNLQAQRERVYAYSLNADFTKRLGRHETNYGLELSYQDVRSAASDFNRATGVSTLRPDLTRYPADGSSYFSAAAYLADRVEIARGLWLNAGARYQFVGVDMDFVRPDQNPPPPVAAFFAESSARFTALTGNLSGVWLPTPAIRLAVVASSGFRAPNVDDLGKFFEAPPGQATDVLIVPNPTLSPEATYNLESTLSWSPTWQAGRERGALTLAGTLWHTWFDQALLLRPTRALGSDSVTYDGQRRATYSIQNAARAQLWGLTGRLSATQGRWALSGTVTYTRGRVIEPLAEPLDHVPPVHGTLSLRHRRSRWNAEALITWHGWKWAADYRPFGEDNLQYATPNGMPAWAIVTLRAEYIFSTRWSAQATLENLQDLHYRVFASGISAPGRNFVLTLRYSW